MRDKLDNQLAKVAARQWGVVSLDDLRACGLTAHAVSRRVKAGRLHPLYRAVYAVGHTNLSLEGRFLAAVKACPPGTVLSHFAAAALYGLVTWDGRHIEVTTPTSAKHHGINTHRSRLRAEDVRRHNRIPTTTPARTLVDLASILPYKPLRRAIREAHGKRLVTLNALREAAQAAGRRPGTATLTRILATGTPPTRSELEDAVLDMIIAGGLQPPQVNVPLIIDGRRIVPDFRWPEQRLVVEADGAAWHDHRLAREDDAERQALLEAHGERVVRVTWDQAIRRRPETLRRLGQAGAPTLPSP